MKFPMRRRENRIQLWMPAEGEASGRLVLAQSGMKATRRTTYLLSDHHLHHPASTRRQNEVTEVIKVPPPAKKPSSKPKQSQERDRSHRRPKRSRACRITSHGINSRSSNCHLRSVDTQALDPSWSGIQRYVKGFVTDTSSKRTCSRNTAEGSNIVSNQIVSMPGRDQSALPESSTRAADPRPTPESESDWKSTTYATTKLAIDLVKESSDVFPPLKSVAGGLSAILNHCEVHCISSRPRRP